MSLEVTQQAASALFEAAVGELEHPIGLLEAREVAPLFARGQPRLPLFFVLRKLVVYLTHPGHVSTIFSY